MNCEICGNKIIGKPNRVVIEGSKLVTCSKCSEFSEKSWESEFQRSQITRTIKPSSIFKDSRRNLRSKSSTKNLEDYEITENFSESLQKGRTKMGISQEKLAKLLKEKLSVIQKIESGKITPSLKLSREIEHLLKIKLLTTEKPNIDYDANKKVTSDLTIGDVFQYKKKEKDEGS
ncbi:multiprotein bridging factor aMBF1 [[Eubacterium] cellulosolvens]